MNEEERRKQIRQAYNETVIDKKRPKTKIYVAVLVIAVMLGALYFMFYTPQGTTMLQNTGIVSTPTTAAEANTVTNELGTKIQETSNLLDDLSASLGP